MAEPTIIEAPAVDDKPSAKSVPVPQVVESSDEDDEDAALQRRQRNLQRAQQRRKEEEALLQQQQQNEDEEEEVSVHVHERTKHVLDGYQEEEEEQVDEDESGSEYESYTDSDDEAPLFKPVFITKFVQKKKHLNYTALNCR